MSREMSGQLGGDGSERKTPTRQRMLIRENSKIVMSFVFERVAFRVGRRP
jgi:hypothetical protein